MSEKIIEQEDNNVAVNVVEETIVSYEENNANDINHIIHEMNSDINICGSEKQRSLLFDAYSKYLGETTNPEFDKYHEHFKMEYATISSVLKTIRPILSKYGLSIMQSISVDENNIVSVSTMLTHNSGAYILYPTMKNKPFKTDMATIGSAITYMKRYQLCSILSINGEPDVDASLDDVSSAKTAKSPTLTIEDIKTEAKRLISISEEYRPKIDAIIAKNSSDGQLKGILKSKLAKTIQELKNLEEKKED